MEEKVFKKSKIRDDIVPNELTKLVALELDCNKDEYVYENKIDIILNPKELSNIRNSIIPTETTKIISLELSGKEQFCTMGFENEEEIEDLNLQRTSSNTLFPIVLRKKLLYEKVAKKNVTVNGIRMKEL